MDISVVIPLFNEEESIPELYSWIERVMNAHGFTYEVIFVNDGSTDRSWLLIEDLQEKHSCVKGIKFRRNYGKSPALYCGFKKAEGDVVFKNIVKYREENGAFTTRRQLLKVPKVGPKAFQQCAGFLRVPESASVLDNTGVHPESYAAAEALLAQCGYTLSDVRAGAMGALKEKAEAMGLEALARVCGVGVPTLADIIKELMKPGRDPRDELPAPILRTDVMEARDLKPGMELQGTVRNVIDFGAFVDIGVHQDGLVHISKLPQRVKHPSQLLSVGDVVTVWVLEVDEKKKRISLTMKKP
mgnify:CR=1 FL=1